MAINIPILTEFSDNGIRAAKAAFANFKTAVADAEGGMGKFKAGSKVALDAVAANAELFAVAGAISFGKFALSGIQSFTDLALQAGKFADATGLEITRASGYIEAAGDIGVPIDTVEGAIGRLNKTIGADPDKVRNLGVDLVYLRDGSLDVNETFLNTIDRIKGIKDPAERARVATQLLGKGWQSMSELIMGGSEKLNASLKSVSEEKLISPEELQMAKDYRAAMDNLGDKVDDLKLKTGERLVKEGTWLAQAAGWVLDLDASFTALIQGTDPLGVAKQKMIDWAQSVRDSRDDTDTLKESIKQARTDAIMPFKDKIVEATTALINADTAWRNLTTSLDEAVALDDAKTKLDELETAAAKAFGTGAQADIDDYEAKLATYAGVLEGISGNMDDISSKEILFRFKTQGPAAALELAGWLARGAEYGGLSSFDALTLAGISGGTRASGGPVAGGSTYLVGERGPELFTPTSAGNITPNGGFGGGANITVNVNGGDPNSIVRALQQYVRQSGPVPVNIRTM